MYAVCGYAYLSAIFNCYNYGRIEYNGEYIFTDDVYCGGIVGRTMETTINNCYNEGTINSYSAQFIERSFGGGSISYESCAGGICGYGRNSSINDSYNKGFISSSSYGFYTGFSLYTSSFSGGICGFGDDTSIDNCYNTGNILATNIYPDSYYASNRAGGIVGLNSYKNSRVTNCFNANVTITSISAGRIVSPSDNNDASNCYSLASTQVNGTTVNSTSATSYNGKDEDISSLQSQSWIADNLGWDFANIWYMSELFDYPLLKRPLIVKAHDYSILYGDALPAFTCHYSGFIEGDTEASLTILPTITCIANTTSSVGTYPIIPSDAAAEQYNFIYQDGILSITQTPLIITANDATRKQGEPNPTFTLSYFGFKNDEDYLVLNELPVASCEANENSIAGNYPIVLSGGNDRNYSYTLVNGILKVIEVTGIDDLLLHDISVYPNPVRENVHIKGAAGKNMVVYDDLGKRILNKRIMSDIEILSLTSWAQGIYFVRIIENGKCLGIIKLIKE